MRIGLRPISVIGLVGLSCSAWACAAESSDDATAAEDQVAIVTQALSQTTVRAVSLAELRASYPAERAATIDLAALTADNVVGWYDKGQNFHEQKMEKNVKADFGDIAINPAVLRGVTIR